MKTLQEQLIEGAEKLGYMRGRNYLSGALLQDYISEPSKEVEEYINKFLTIHHDLEVEVK